MQTEKIPRHLLDIYKMSEHYRCISNKCNRVVQQKDSYCDRCFGEEAKKRFYGESDKDSSGSPFNIRHLEQNHGGYVYFLLGEGTGRVKIGYSNQLYTRIGEMQTGSPVKLTLLGMIKAPRYIERYLHIKYKSERAGGEWFRLSESLLELIGMDRNISADIEHLYDHDWAHLNDEESHGKVKKELEDLIDLYV